VLRVSVEGPDRGKRIGALAACQGIDRVVHLGVPFGWLERGLKIPVSAMTPPQPRAEWESENARRVQGPEKTRWKDGGEAINGLMPSRALIIAQMF
jgi:hypothetical protein